MSATLTIALSDGTRATSQDLAVPVVPSTVEALGGALPSLDQIANLVRTKPDTALQMVRDYQAGRLDAAMATANDLGLSAQRSTGEGQAGVAAVILLIIIAIILILLFPKPVKAPTKPPTQS